MFDYMLLLAYFSIVYGTAWAIPARRLACHNTFERIVATILIVHLGAYAVFLFHFLINLPYLLAPALLMYAFFLFSIQWLLSDFEATTPSETQIQTTERFIWIFFTISFFVLFLCFSYRVGSQGGMYHTYLDLWRFHQGTTLSYPDLQQIGYQFRFSPLFFPPLYYSNALLLTCGLKSINTAISGFGLVHFMSLLGVVAFIHLLLKEITGNNKLSYIAWLFFATWQYHGGRSYWFCPDHNSFVGFFTLGVIYYLLRYCRTFSLNNLWLFATAFILGFNNRFWLMGCFAGFFIVFIDKFVESTKIGYKHLLSWKTLALFILIGLIGSYWILGVYQFGHSTNPFGVYQNALEKNYGAKDLSHYYSVQQFFIGAPQIITQSWGHIFENFFQAHRGYTLPLYLTILGLLGLCFYAWRFRSESTTWRFVAGLFLAIYLSGFISTPVYPRGHLWLIPIFLLFAALFVNEGNRLIRGSPWEIPWFVKSIAIICLIYFAALGVKRFSNDIYWLAMQKKDIENYAHSVQLAKPSGTKTLIFTFEPGADLDAFMENEYFWENYYFFPGIMGDAMFEAVFPGYKIGNAINPCSLPERGISVIDVTFREELLFKILGWTEEQAIVLKNILAWTNRYPDVFPLIGECPYGRKAYLVNWDILDKKFRCGTSKK